MCIDELDVKAGAPGPIDRTDSVRIPVNPPVVRGLVTEVGDSSPESVLRGDVADSNMHGLSGEEFLRTGKNLEGSAALLQLVNFTSRVNLWGWLRRIVLGPNS
jgi:hypothetical protein